MPVLWQTVGRSLGRGFHGECAYKLSKMLWKLSKKATRALVCLLLRFTRHNAHPMTRLNTLLKRYAIVLIFSYSASIIEQKKRKKESIVALSSWISRAMRAHFKALPVYFAFRGRGGGIFAIWRKSHYSSIRRLRELSRLPILLLGLFGVDTNFRIPDTLTKSSLGSILKEAFCTGLFILVPRTKIATAPRASRALSVMRLSNKPTFPF